MDYNDTIYFAHYLCSVVYSSPPLIRPLPTKANTIIKPIFRYTDIVKYY